ncbi:ferredoxin [Candidatus Woesearchaeota archaeon]|nr:ferredoxin [Candidatus Woesearchaeota archaeon]
MPKLRIEINKTACIDNENCVKNDPKNFEIKNEKAVMKKGITNDALSYLEINTSEKEAENIIRAANSCPVNAIKVINLETKKEIVSTQVKEESVKEIKAEYDDSKEFILDPAGYFLIRINKEKQLIEIGFCNERNKLILKITGKKPIEIYHTIINKLNLPIRKDHCAYLGRELQKAYIALQNNLGYVQDDELKFN